MATIFKQKGRDTYYIGYTINGKRVTKNTFIPFNQPKKAELLKKEIESELKLLKNKKKKTTNTFGYKSDRSSLRDCSEQFIALHKVNWSKGRIDNVTTVLKQFLAIINGNRMIKDVSAQDISNYIYLRKQIVSTTTLRSDIQILRTFFNYLAEENILTRSPISKKFIPKPEHKAIVTFEQTDLDLIHEYSRNMDINFYRFLFLLEATGARPSDILNLSYSDIEIKRKTIRIKISKTSREIIFPLYLGLMNFIKCEYPNIEGHNSDMKLFKDIRLYSYHRRFTKMKKQLGLRKEYNLRTFRKYFATSLIDAGIDGSIVAYLLGHTSVNTTAKYYISKKADIIRNTLNGLKL